MQYEDYLKELQQKIAYLITEHEDRFDVFITASMRSNVVNAAYCYDGEKFVEGKVPNEI